MCSPRSLVQVEISEPHPRRPKCVVPCVAQSVQLPGSAPWVGCCRPGTTVAGTLELVLGHAAGTQNAWLSKLCCSLWNWWNVCLKLSEGSHSGLARQVSRWLASLVRGRGRVKSVFGKDSVETDGRRQRERDIDGSVYWHKDWKPWPSKSARLWVVWPQLTSVTSGYLTPEPLPS